MAYVTGSAADMAAVKTALVNACTANGWTEQTDAGGKTVLSNGGCYVRVETQSYSDTDFTDDTRDVLELLGRTGLDSGDTPRVVSLGDYRDDRGIYPVDISFPVTYHAFIFTNEVFFIIQYNTFYQWCAFGQSQQSGLSGTGNWVAATFGTPTIARSDYPIKISPESGGDNYDFGNTSGALFWATEWADDNISLNGWIHNDIESTYPWALGNGTNSGFPVGIRYLTELINAQPNQFSGEAVLLPIRAYKIRPDSKVSQILEIENARHIRIDNYTDEQIITLGTDEWMVFPYFQRNVDERDGPVYDMDHTGTFGWAIKKA